ncbi:MAG: outer membrane beta-barrel protein [Thiobacillus sp.]|nr:outer membrane beta-barrel protein [Thiobacillus sp.]
MVLGMLLVMPAQAKEGDTLRPFVSLGHFYDSNLFRLAESEYSQVSQRSEQYDVLSAGLNVDWKLGRQQLVVNATKTLVRYDLNTVYDSDGSDYKATWNWRLGNRLTGNLGATESLSQSNFDSVGLVNNQVKRKRSFGRAEWEFHPRWRIGGGVEKTDNTNSALSQASNDFQQQAIDAALIYRTPKGSNIRVQMRQIEADFSTLKILEYHPFLPVVAVSDNSYKQTDYKLLGEWRMSGKLTLHGQAGWVDRQYKNILKGSFGGYSPWLVDRPDFSGFVGRVSGDWYATGKTLLSASAYRELGGAQDINASSVLKTGASADGVWLIREKWRLNAGATFENREFRGELDPNSTAPQRNDDTLGASLSLNYAPTQAVSLDVGMRVGRRDSNISVENYEFKSLFANVRADF